MIKILTNKDLGGTLLIFQLKSEIQRLRELLAGNFSESNAILELKTQTEILNHDKKKLKN